MEFTSEDDWIEPFRQTIYPRLHPYLKPFGGYSLGHVGEQQYLGKVNESEEAIEQELDDRARRNPIACLKKLDDGRVSEGSWVLLHEDNPDLIEKGMQLHITMFVREDGEPGRELYAHYEDDWRADWRDHLNSANLSASKGVALATDYLNEHTYLILQ